MAVVTLYRLAEQTFNLLEGGDPGIAASISIPELKIACGQVINNLLKIDYMSTNVKMGELIPNGSVLALYETIPVQKWNDRSRASLPIKPLKLARDIGVYSVYPSGQPDKEFIPIQIGQSSLLQSQPLINNVLGQVTRETQGAYVVFSKDLTQSGPYTVDMKLVVMDISQYGDWDILPVMPEWEWDIVSEVYKMYSSQPIPDKLVDPSVKEAKGMPTQQQKQS